MEVKLRSVIGPEDPSRTLPGAVGRAIALVRSSGPVLAAIALSIAVASPLEGQRRGNPDFGGRGFFVFGLHDLDVGELNERFDAQDYPQVDEWLKSVGFAGLKARGRVLIGGEGHALIGPRESVMGDAFTVRVTGGYGLFNLGYAAFQESGFRVYPMIGIGGGMLAVSIHERSAPTFDDVLANPTRGAELGSAQFLLDASLGLDFLFRTGRRGGPAIGVRGGYMFAPLRAEWDSEYGDLADGPDSGFTGPYIRVMIGGGRR